MDRKESETLVNAAQLLKDFCKNQTCDECPFHEKRAILALTNCILANSCPEKWQMPTLPRWTDADKAYAAAIKQFGVYAVKRNEHGAIRYISTVGAATCDDYVVNGILVDLKKGEQIFIDQIINEGAENHE